MSVHGVSDMSSEWPWFLQLWMLQLLLQPCHPFFSYDDWFEHDDDHKWWFDDESYDHNYWFDDESYEQESEHMDKYGSQNFPINTGGGTEWVYLNAARLFSKLSKI